LALNLIFDKKRTKLPTTTTKLVYESFLVANDDYQNINQIPYFCHAF